MWVREWVSEFSPHETGNIFIPKANTHWLCDSLYNAVFTVILQQLCNCCSYLCMCVLLWYCCVWINTTNWISLLRQKVKVNVSSLVRCVLCDHRLEIRAAAAELCCVKRYEQWTCLNVSGFPFSSIVMQFGLRSKCDKLKAAPFSNSVLKWVSWQCAVLKVLLWQAQIQSSSDTCKPEEGNILGKVVCLGKILVQ